MSKQEREHLIEWLACMTAYSKSYLDKLNDAELEQLYAEKLGDESGGTEMIGQATEKLQGEMREANNPYTNVIGEFLKDYITKHPSEATHILAEGKTIKGSLEAMTAAARKKAKNGMAMLTDQEGYAIVLGYYGMSVVGELKSAIVVVTDVVETTEAAPKFTASLDEFL